MSHIKNRSLRKVVSLLGNKNLLRHFVNQSIIKTRGVIVSLIAFKLHDRDVSLLCNKTLKYLVNLTSSKPLKRTVSLLTIKLLDAYVSLSRIKLLRKNAEVVKWTN